MVEREISMHGANHRERIQHFSGCFMYPKLSARTTPGFPFSLLPSVPFRSPSLCTLSQSTRKSAPATLPYSTRALVGINISKLPRYICASVI